MPRSTEPHPLRAVISTGAEVASSSPRIQFRMPGPWTFGFALTGLIVFGVMATIYIEDAYDAWAHPKEHAARLAAEAIQERMLAGDFRSTDFPKEKWPWPDATRVHLKCHGSKDWPMTTLTMPGGTEYGLNGPAQEAGWPSILDTLARGPHGVFDPPVPEELNNAALLLCPDQIDASAYRQCFDPVDGVPLQVEDAIKSRLRDPDSFQVGRVTATAPDAQGVLQFRITYRAKNGFGGMNLGMVRGHMRVPDCNATIDASVDNM